MHDCSQEQAKAPSGSPTRQVARVFDSMNRPFKVTAGTTQYANRSNHITPSNEPS